MYWYHSAPASASGTVKVEIGRERTTITGNFASAAVPAGTITLRFRPKNPAQNLNHPITVPSLSTNTYSLRFPVWAPWVREFVKRGSHGASRRAYLGEREGIAGCIAARLAWHRWCRCSC